MALCRQASAGAGVRAAEGATASDTSPHRAEHHESRNSRVPTMLRDAHPATRTTQHAPGPVPTARHAQARQPRGASPGPPRPAPGNLGARARPRLSTPTRRELRPGRPCSHRRPPHRMPPGPAALQCCRSAPQPHEEVGVKWALVWGAAAGCEPPARLLGAAPL